MAVMSHHAARSRTVPLESPRRGREAQIRRYRLARLVVEGQSSRGADRSQRYLHLRRIYD